mmetsp:Transcript_28443/g.70069  ORF Transcript_28443/g.70069 Transcript_28443/m.70069 type:complete len:224 (-) Transcript_28443:504-1175(-)
MPHTAACGGSASVPFTSAGRHSSDSRQPSRPHALAIWSMTPQGAPTTRFSTFWHSMASSRPAAVSGSSANSMPNAAATAHMAATSTAAEDDTPLPSGTSEDSRITMLSLSSSALNSTPFSRASTSRAPATYAAHCVAASLANMTRASAYVSGAVPSAPPSPEPVPRRSARGISNTEARSASSPPTAGDTMVMVAGCSRLTRRRRCSATWHASAMGICSTNAPL